MGKLGEVGGQIRRLRLAAGMTQQDLAEEVGLSVESLSRAERGATLPTVLTLGRIADVLGTSLDTLAGRASTVAGLAGVARIDTEPAELLRLTRLLRRLDRQSLRRILGVVELVPPARRR